MAESDKDQKVRRARGICERYQGYLSIQSLGVIKI